MHKHTHHRKSKTSIRSLAKRVTELEDDEERKFEDLYRTNQAPVAASALVQPEVLNVVLQNDSRSGRNGAKIDLSSIQLDFWYAPKSCLNTTDLATINCTPLAILIRFICVWFPSVGIDAPLPCRQLQTLGNVLEEPRAVQSFYKRDGAVNYKILLDRTHKVEYAQTSQATAIWAPLSGSDFKFRKTIPLNKQCTYVSAAQPPAVSGDPVKGTLVYYVIEECTQPILAVSAGTYQLASRLTWTDD